MQYGGINRSTTGGRRKYISAIKGRTKTSKIHYRRFYLLYPLLLSRQPGPPYSSQTRDADRGVQHGDTENRCRGGPVGRVGEVTLGQKFACSDVEEKPGE